MEAVINITEEEIVASLPIAKKRRKINKALYTLAVERLRYTYPNAVDRREVIKQIIDSYTGSFEPTRITAQLEHVINKTYMDAYDIKKVSEALNNTINNLPEHMAEHLTDVKKVISDGQKFYENVMGEPLRLSARQADEMIPF